MNLKKLFGREQTPPDLERVFSDHKFGLEWMVSDLLDECDLKDGPQEGYHWEYVAIHALSGIKVFSSPTKLTVGMDPEMCKLVIPGNPDIEFPSQKIADRMEHELKKKEMTSQINQFHLAMCSLCDALELRYAHREAEAKKKDLMNKMLEATDPKN